MKPPPPLQQKILCVFNQRLSQIPHGVKLLVKHLHFVLNWSPSPFRRHPERQHQANITLASQSAFSPTSNQLSAQLLGGPKIDWGSFCVVTDESALNHREKIVGISNLVSANVHQEAYYSVLVTSDRLRVHLECILLAFLVFTSHPGTVK